jgi:hypothetical protein
MSTEFVDHPKVKSDGRVILLMLVFVALVMLTKWLFPHSGWTPMESYPRKLVTA